MAIELTREFLLSRLVYDPETGLFQRIMRKNKGKLKPAGFVNKSHGTYIIISLMCKKFMAHQLAWFYMYGVFPSKEIDHIDGDSTNNKISNLRLVSREDNSKNMKLFKTNTSGHCGVYFHKQTGKWNAKIKEGYKSHDLGLFDNKNDAIEARKRAEIKFGFHANHGLSKMKELQSCAAQKEAFDTLPDDYETGDY